MSDLVKTKVRQIFRKLQQVMPVAQIPSREREKRTSIKFGGIRLKTADWVQ